VHWIVEETKVKHCRPTAKPLPRLTVVPPEAHPRQPVVTMEAGADLQARVDRLAAMAEDALTMSWDPGRITPEQAAAEDKIAAAELLEAQLGARVDRMVEAAKVAEDLCIPMPDLDCDVCERPIPPDAEACSCGNPCITPSEIEEWDMCPACSFTIPCGAGKCLHCGAKLAFDPEQEFQKDPACARVVSFEDGPPVIATGMRVPRQLAQTSFDTYDEPLPGGVIEIEHHKCPSCDGEMTVIEVTPGSYQVNVRCLGACKFRRIFSRSEFESWQAQAAMFRKHLPKPLKLGVDCYECADCGRIVEEPPPSEGPELCPDCAAQGVQ
jgi:hypothetical protein